MLKSPCQGKPFVMLCVKIPIISFSPNPYCLCGKKIKNKKNLKKKDEATKKKAFKYKFTYDRPKLSPIKCI